MDLPILKFGQWTIETAQMKHTARKYSMATVAQTHLRKAAAIAGVADYQELLTTVRDNPEAYETLTEAEREFMDMSASVGVWSTVAACIKPYISIDEWLAFTENTVNELSGAAEKVNPHWFTLPEQEKKTDEQPPQSISE